MERDLTWEIALYKILGEGRFCSNCKNCKTYDDDNEHYYCKLDGQQVLDDQYCGSWKAKRKK